MAPQDTLYVLETAVRQALAADQLAQAGFALERYVAEVGLQARSIDARSPKARELERRAHETLEFAVMMALASREDATAELGRLTSLKAYGRGKPRRVDFRAEA
jgi:hypothetical protein